MATLKEQLYQLCADYITNREIAIKKIISDAHDAIANETKSSAGDKYETTREVMQQEINLNQIRLNELNKLRSTLDHISPAQAGSEVQPGSLVYTSDGNFYISISAGQLKANNTGFYAISAVSPLGTRLLGQQVGHSFDLKGKKFTIVRVE
jgi:transcription elongation GreA/GreB family factor